jgi:hypothetical protein
MREDPTRRSQLKRIVIWPIVAGVLICLCSGCGREPFPKKPLKPVKGFSLGGARVPHFKQRPTAQELYHATLKLYDSFKSAATSEESVHGPLSPQALQRTGQLRLKKISGRTTTEARAIEPGKRLEVYDMGAMRSVDWTNNGRSYSMYDTREGRVCARQAVVESHSAAASWAGLVAGRFFSRTPPRLRPDEIVNGTPTYVLEFRVTQKGHAVDRPVRTVRLYLGKADLLLRRKEVITEVTPAGGQLLRGSISTVLGFVANPKLSPALFPTDPPRDAERDKNTVEKSP